MSDWNASANGNNTGTITPYSPESLGAVLSTYSAANAVWPTASMALYVPFRVFEPRTAYQLVWQNGNVVSGNVDCGIYTSQGGLVVSAGSTAQAGASAIQAADVADTVLVPALYYMGLVLDNVTGSFWRIANPVAPIAGAVGMYQQASAFVLPGTAAFAACVQAYIPLFGVSTRSLV